MNEKTMNKEVEIGKLQPCGCELQRGQIIYGIVRHVARGGMSRTIDLININKEGQPWPITAFLCDKHKEVFMKNHKYDNKYQGWKIHGAGMDMIFALVHELSRTVFAKDGIKDENGEDAGYVLKHQQL
jgi:hypothetical protein